MVPNEAMRDWNQNYAAQETPWDTGEPDAHLVELFEAGELPAGRVLEVGCGTGTNALWLAQRGFDVTATDLAPLAIEKAEAKRPAAGLPAGARVRFAVADFLTDAPAGAPFDLVFDRGVFHVFDEASVRARFAERAASALRVGGRWLSLAGSTEGPARDHGPPRRSARDLVAAVEPHLALVSLRATRFAADLPSPALAWAMLAERREVPAQPSTRRDTEE
jgi:SAM-dependent methyltransferase